MASSMAVCPQLVCEILQCVIRVKIVTIIVPGHICSTRYHDRWDMLIYKCQKHNTGPGFKTRWVQYTFYPASDWLPQHYIVERSLVCVEGRGRISQSGLTQDIIMGSCVFQCNVPHWWTAQRQVGPMYVYRGKKITCPGARDKLNFSQDKHIFSTNVQRTSKKFSASLFDNIFRTS